MPFAFLIVFLFIIFLVNISKVLDEIDNDVAVQESRVNQFISKAHSISDSIIVYANSYLENDAPNEPVSMDYFVFNDELGAYTLNYPGSIPSNGVNVVGLETIPTEGLDKKELYLAISLGNMFSLYYESIPEINQMFYTSANGYTSFYPWTNGDEFANPDTVKEQDYYKMATPENNPTRGKVWCPLYEGSGDKGNLFTLSQPLYYNDEFLGVVSIEFSNVTFGNRFTTDYDCYVVNEFDQILGTNNEDVPSEIVTTSDYFGSTYEELVAEIDEDSGVIGSSFMYIETFDLAKSDYFHGFIAVPIPQILMESFVNTIPILLLVIILFLVLKSLENRKKSYNSLEKVKDDLAFLTVTDPLTGIHNRRKFDEVLLERLADKTCNNLHLAIIDLDYFKSINDRFGHDVGDTVLIAFANLLVKNVNECEYENVDIHYSRIGGEEFAIIFTGCTDEEVKSFCETLRSSVENYEFEIDLNLTISIGATRAHYQESHTDAYKKADNKLYEAKLAGRNKVMFHL